MWILSAPAAISSKNALCRSELAPNAVITSASVVAWTTSRFETPPVSSFVLLLAITTILGPLGISCLETL